MLKRTCLRILRGMALPLRPRGFRTALTLVVVNAIMLQTVLNFAEQGTVN